jgi:hypothetical protein
VSQVVEPEIGAAGGLAGDVVAVTPALALGLAAVQRRGCELAAVAGREQEPWRAGLRVLEQVLTHERQQVRRDGDVAAARATLRVLHHGLTGGADHTATHADDALAGEHVGAAQLCQLREPESAPCSQ